MSDDQEPGAGLRAWERHKAHPYRSQVVIPFGESANAIEAALVRESQSAAHEAIAARESERGARSGAEHELHDLRNKVSSYAATIRVTAKYLGVALDETCASSGWHIPLWENAKERAVMLAASEAVTLQAAYERGRMESVADLDAAKAEGVAEEREKIAQRIAARVRDGAMLSEMITCVANAPVSLTADALRTIATYLTQIERKEPTDAER